MVDQTDSTSKVVSSSPVSGGSETSAKKRRLNKKWLIIGLVVVAALAATVFKGVDYIRQENTKKQDALAVKKAGPGPSKEVRAQYQNDYVDKLQSQITNEQDVKKQAKLYGDLANEQLIAGNKIAAVESAKKAFELDPSVNYAGLTANMAAASNDWKTAAEWFKKAAELSPKTALTENSDYTYFTSEQKRAESHL